MADHEALRRKVATDVRTFLAAGGRIERVPVGVSGGDAGRKRRRMNNDLGLLSKQTRKRDIP